MPTRGSLRANDKLCARGHEFTAENTGIKASNGTRYCKECNAQRCRAYVSSRPNYVLWWRMMCRCTSPKSGNYRDYGARGISVCDRWKKYEHFVEDMGKRPAGMTLDRIDVNGNYEPSNCRWATSTQQSLNRRDTIRVEWNGKSTTLVELSREYGMHYPHVWRRIFEMGWTLERAILTPFKKTRRTA